VSGWTPVATVTTSRYCGRQHLVDLNGATWVRLNVTRGSSDSASVSLDMDVQSAPSGASDAWLFMGDSITYMSMTHAFADVPGLVRAARPGSWPAILDAAIGGTNTSTALAVIDDTMQDFPGRYVVLAYGTNDHPQDFKMEALVAKVLAAGKIPVIPHMPWSASSTEGPAINLAIDALYAKYPAIVRGPDLWAFFSGRTDLIPANDVHPNAAGQEELRKQWAQTLAALP
jgi:lysophospholipase L1-like esterase